MSWSYCRICHNTTPALPLSDNAWKYSFGKYLELSFWCRGMRVKGATCEHDFYRDQIHYFSFQHLAVRVEYTDIETLQLVPPKFQLFWQPEYDIKIKIETYHSVLVKAAEFFDSVRERLNRVKVDSMTIDKMEAGQKRIEELKMRVEQEHQEIKELVDQIYLNTPVTEHLQLNSAVRQVQELSTDWNSEFDDFDKKFLPTEKEIKRITTFQLDKLFGVGTKEETKDEVKNEEGEESGDEVDDEKQSGSNEKVKEKKQVQVEVKPKERSPTPPLEDPNNEHADDEREDDEECEEDKQQSLQSPENTEGQTIERAAKPQEIPELAKGNLSNSQQVNEGTGASQSLPSGQAPRISFTESAFDDSATDTSGTEFSKVSTSPSAGRLKGSLVLEKINELASSSDAHSPIITPKRQPLRAKSESYSDRRLLWETGNKEFQDHILNNNDEVLSRLDLKGTADTGGKVKKLTEFFDAQEFFREREEEKQKLANANKYLPKVRASKARVQIYKDVFDVFDDSGKDRTISLTQWKQQQQLQKEHQQQLLIEQAKDDSILTSDDTGNVSSDELSEDEYEDSNETNSNQQNKSPLVQKKNIDIKGHYKDQSGNSDSRNDNAEGDNQSSHSDEESLNDSAENSSKDQQSNESPSVKPQQQQKQQIQNQQSQQQAPQQPPQQTVQKKPTTDNQPERVSLLKSLRHFWADRSASLWEPLSYPLSPSEHIFVDSDVIVREDEPSSIIAFCLNTSDYSSKLYSTQSTTGNANVSQPVARDDVSMASKMPDDSTNPTIMVNDAPPPELNLEEIMLKKGFHLKYQFEEGCSIISCKIFFAEQFDAFRRQCGVTDNFIQSLSRCVKWDSTGGKSGSAFLKTLDDRFIIKELSRTELEAFVQFAPSYFEYFAEALFHGLPTVLGKIFGFYQIQVKNSIPGAKSYTLDVLIMENLFYHRKMTRIFDLKGSMRNRHVEQTGKENEVLLDENMVEYIYESPLFVRENNKKLLRTSLWNDTLFLAKVNVMDYSLVIGIDSEKNELVVERFGWWNRCW
ncbi:unnamed protein product [Ambrosiozyma monospora]|uniref:Unnamed protein product n=1 Tax=Ambrosiozyma monospora TaxID=43982 RepID=A0A9W6Z050_AMBMO|nr:unnamed protein product [Ambrosiozyma monospora]